MPAIPRKLKKKMEDAVVGELSYLPSQEVNKSPTDSGIFRLPAVTLRKGAQTGSFTLNAADGRPRVGVTQ